MDSSPPGSSVHGMLQARILEWVAMPSSRGASQPKDQTLVSYVSCIVRRVLYSSATWEASLFCVISQISLCLPFTGRHVIALSAHLDNPTPSPHLKGLAWITCFAI